MTLNYPYILILFLILIFSACQTSVTPLTDTPTSGSVSIGSDENFLPIIDAQHRVFEKIYTHATITIDYASEREIINAFMQDSIQLAILSRPLTFEELQYFKPYGFTPRTTKIAYDGIALITHPKNKDSMLTFTQLQEILNGKVTKWQQINPKAALADIQIIFDNANSSTIRHIKDSVLFNQPLSKNIYALHNNTEVVEYVSNNANSLGIIGVNWVSDFQDSLSINFLQKIKVISLAPNENQKGYGNFYQPFQSYIATKEYPICRTLYAISREPRQGLATGFAAFLASDRGQRIILKSGLVPATMPIRLVNVN